MINYGLPVKDQKFKRRPHPKDIKFWDKQDRDEFVEAEWHRRRNGYWILIKGKPFYFTGAFDTFLNYWTCEYGGLPEFRVSGWELFMFWWSVELDPNCFGMIIIKPRRVGDTEGALFLTWNRSTLYENAHGGIIHIKESGAIKNFERLVKGNNGMPFWFKPYNEGTTNPKGGELSFKVPAEKVTKKMIKEGRFHNDEDESGLGSVIYVEPAVTGAYDGVRLFTYYSDEIFKVKNKKFNIIEQWKNIKKVLSLNNSTRIIGKAIKTSTVEEVETAEGAEVFTVDIARKMVEDSTTVIPGTKRTVTGLAFFFRNFERAADVDEWGFHKAEEARADRQKRINFYRENKMWDDLLSLYRKEPDTIDEALSAPMGDAVLYPELCEERLRQLSEGIDKLGQKQQRRGQYGRLAWKNGIFGGEVEWIPAPANQEDKWYISQHPKRANHKVSVQGKAYPGNMAYYRMGVDPFETTKTSGKGSDGAFTIKRLFDPMDEPLLKMDQNGQPINVWDMYTNQIVCDYKHDRAVDTLYDFYDDVYKSCVYFGVAAFPETNKKGLNEWMELNDLHFYLQVVPDSVQASSSRKKEEKGKAATSAIINKYVSQLKLFILQFIWCQHHPRVIKDWSLFTVKNRTLRDLSVASGFTELAEMDTRYEEDETDEKDDSWSETPYERYK